MNYVDLTDVSDADFRAELDCFDLGPFVLFYMAVISLGEFLEYIFDGYSGVYSGKVVGMT